MIVLLFGAPGTGKSTYARYLAEKINLTWVSTGNILREMGERDEKIRSIMNSGQLIPDEEVNRLVFAKLSEVGSNFILDGFPRTLGQAQSFADFLKAKGWAIDRIYHLNVPVETVVARMTARGRGDDTPESIKERFNVFEELTKPVIEYFENAGVRRFEIDNTPPIDVVKKQFDQTLHG